MKKKENLAFDTDKPGQKQTTQKREKAFHSGAVPAESDMLKLIEELELQKTELEVQNIQLVNANMQVQKAFGKYNELYELSPSGYFTLTRDGLITELNPSAADMLVHNRATGIGKRLEGYIEVNSKLIFRDFLNQVFESRGKVSCEVLLATDDHHIQRSLYLTGSVIGNGEQCLLVAIDFTERRKADNLLAESEIKYRGLVENLPDSIVIYTGGKIVFVNKEVLRLMGANHYDELIGQPVLQFVHPDSRALVVERMRIASYKGAVLPPVEEKFLRLDGSIVFTEVIAMSVLFENQSAVQLIIRDISDRKDAEKALHESEAKFREMADMLPQIIFETDNQGRFLFVNKRAFEIFGYPEDFKIIGRNSLDFHIPEERKLAEENMRNQFSGMPSDNNEYTMVRQDGSTFQALVYSNLIFNDGVPVGLRGILVDISERKQVEKKLIDSEQRYRLLVETTNEGILVAQGSHLKFVNQTLTQITGFTKEELLSIPFIEFVHEDDRPLIRSNFLKRIKGEPIDNRYSFRMIKKDKSVKWFELSGVRIEWEGQPAIMNLVTDITERVLAEEELRKSEEKFREFFEENTDGITIFELSAEGPPSGIIDLNENAARMLGYTKDELMLLSPVNMEKDITPEKIGEREKELLQNGIVNFESTLLRKDGKAIIVEIKAKVINYNNRPALMNIVRDITERKQSEEDLRISEALYRAILNASPDAILIADIDGRYIKVSQSAVELAGFWSEEEMLGRNFSDFIHPGDKERVYSHITLMLQGIKTGPNQYRGVRADGGSIDIEVNGAYIKDAEGKPSLMVFNVRDIHERKLQDEKIRQQNEQLQKSNSEKDKFFSIIAHDLRSPFNGFLGLTQIMAEELPHLTMQELQRIAESLKNSATNLFRLLENLLQWARIQRGAIPFNPEKLPLGMAFDESIGMVREAASAKGIEIVNNVQADFQVFADSNMLQTVLRNIVSNAVKFTNNSGWVTIHATRLAGGLTEISITDTGIGMSREILESLFLLHEHSGRNGTAGEPSTGLGLIICKEFVEYMGGSIRVQSVTGEGSVFYINLPDTEKEGDSFKRKSGMVEQIILKPAHNLKILIAEDDEASEMLITMAVNSFSNQILTVRNGPDAVKVCRSNPDIDLVLMDLKLPLMDGYEATRQIRSFNRDVVVFVQSAFHSREDQAKAKEAGCNEFIPKPLNIAHLKTKVLSYFGNLDARSIN